MESSIAFKVASISAVVWAVERNQRPKPLGYIKTPRSRRASLEFAEFQEVGILGGIAIFAQSVLAKNRLGKMRRRAAPAREFRRGQKYLACLLPSYR